MGWISGYGELQSDVETLQGCGIKGFIPTSVIRGNPRFYDQISLWQARSIVSQKWLFPTALKRYHSWFRVAHSAGGGPSHSQEKVAVSANGLDALSVVSPRLASCSSLNTLLVLFCYPTMVDPQKPHPNRFLESESKPKFAQNQRPALASDERQSVGVESPRRFRGGSR